MMKTVWAPIVVLALFAAVACHNEGAVAQAIPVPPGQSSTPLATASGVSITTGVPPAARSTALLPISLGTAPPLGVVDGVAIFDSTSGTTGVRLSDGRLLWTARGAATVQMIGRSTFVATADTVLLQRRAGQGADLVAIDARSGATTGTLRNSGDAFALDGFAYVSTRAGYAARNARTLMPLWHSAGFGGGPVGPAELRGNVLVETFVNGGATINTTAFGIDVRNGHALWTDGSNGPPIGHARGSVYLDSKPTIRPSHATDRSMSPSEARRSQSSE